VPLILCGPPWLIVILLVAWLVWHFRDEWRD
jgi:hypothetical protein